MSGISFRAFRRDRRGSVAVETAISVSVLVMAFAAIVQIVHSAYVSDRMGRAARAATRAIALAPEAAGTTLEERACEAIRRELDLGDGFDCKSRLTVTVETELATSGVLKDADAEEDEDSDAETGELVVVRIAWSGGPWNPGVLLADDDAASRRGAIGIARAEPARES